MKRTQNVTVPVQIVNGSLSLDVEGTPEYQDLVRNYNAAIAREQNNLSNLRKVEAERDGLSQRVNDLIAENATLRSKNAALPTPAARPRTQTDVNNPSSPPTPKLSRLDMQVLGMDKTARRKQYAKQGGEHPDDATDVRLPELPKGFRLESKTPTVHNQYGSIKTKYYWFDVYTEEWAPGISHGNISDRPVYVALPKE